MSDIRKRSLKATSWIYVGFLIGLVNTYFLTHKDWFSTDQNGLTRSLIDISQLVFAFSCLGANSFLFKFFPYYKDNLESRENDLLGVAVRVACIGFIITIAGLMLLQPIVVQKFSEHSILLVQYFYWVIPMSFFILLYNLLEAYSIGFDKGVVTSMLKETLLRGYVFIIIILKIFDFISFDTFIALFAFQYLLIVLVLALYLRSKNSLWIVFKKSKVTKKFRKKIIAIMAFTFAVIVVSVLRQSIDGLILAAKQSLGKVGIFGLASYMVSVIMAPYRSIIAITIPVLSRAWKKKDISEINRVYKRSSINMLTFALFLFLLIWMNFSDAIHFFNINPDYLEGKWVFFTLGLVCIIEMGTGVNAQIIGTSTYWRFELWTSLLLTSLIIPLSYFLTVKYGIIGPAIANLISFIVYNAIRYIFLLKKFGLQPFSSKTAEIIIIAVLVFVPVHVALHQMHSLIGMILRSVVFVAGFGVLVYIRDITPDLKPIIENMKKRFRP